MRISDWSSDVCSSDLWPCLRGGVCGKQDPDRSSRRWWKGRFRLRSRLPMNPGPESGPGRGDDCSVPRGGVDLQIGRASCRERVCQYVSISVVAVSLKKKQVKTVRFAFSIINK